MAEITSAKAMARTVRVSPRKSRLVLDNIRGKSVADAIAILTFTPNKDFVGTPDGISVQAKDANGTPATAKYTPTVKPVTPKSETARNISGNRLIMPIHIALLAYSVKCPSSY